MLTARRSFSPSVRTGLVALALGGALAACGSSSSGAHTTSSSGSAGSTSSASGSTSSSSGGGEAGSGGSTASSTSTSTGTSTATSTSGASSGTTSSASAGSSGSSSSGACAPSKIYLAPPVLVPVQAESPYAVVVADVNKDGKADLIGGYGVGASILLGNGDGTFQPEVDVTGGGGSSIAVADFDGDGFPDIMSFTGQNASFAANYGDGTGHFQSYVGSVMTAAEISIGIAADMNGDGKPDLVMITDTLEVALNSGKAAFGTLATAYNGGSAWERTFGDTGHAANGVLAVDVDGDGNLDVVIGSNAAQNLNDPTAGGLCVLINTGHGSSFADPVCYPVTSDLDVFSIAVADLNGDGAPDFVLGGSSATNTYNVFLNNGGKTGTFKLPVAYKTSTNLGATNISLADMNGDGKLDIVGFYDYGGVTVSLGNGDGTFANTSTAYSAGDAQNANQALATGVFTANGLQSVVVADVDTTANAPNGGLQVLLGTCGM